MKKIVAIILVVAMVLSFAGCNTSEETVVQTETPQVVTPAPATVSPTVAPTAEPTVEPTVEPSATTSIWSYISLGGSGSSSSSSTPTVTVAPTVEPTTEPTTPDDPDDPDDPTPDEPTSDEWDGKDALSGDSDSVYEYTGDGDFAVSPDFYGTLNVYGYYGDITIEMENATVNFYGTADSAKVSTADTSFHLYGKIGYLTALKGSFYTVDDGSIGMLYIASADVFAINVSSDTVIKLAAGVVPSVVGGDYEDVLSNIPIEIFGELTISYNEDKEAYEITGTIEYEELTFVGTILLCDGRYELASGAKFAYGEESVTLPYGIIFEYSQEGDEIIIDLIIMDGDEVAFELADVADIEISVASGVAVSGTILDGLDFVIDITADGYLKEVSIDGVSFQVEDSAFAQDMVYFAGYADGVYVVTDLAYDAETKIFAGVISVDGFKVEIVEASYVGGYFTGDIKVDGTVFAVRKFKIDYQTQYLSGKVEVDGFLVTFATEGVKFVDGTLYGNASLEISGAYIPVKLSGGEIILTEDFAIEEIDMVICEGAKVAIIDGNANITGTITVSGVDVAVSDLYISSDDYTLNGKITVSGNALSDIIAPVIEEYLSDYEEYLSDYEISITSVGIELVGVGYSKASILTGKIGVLSVDGTVYINGKEQSIAKVLSDAIDYDYIPKDGNYYAVIDLSTLVPLEYTFAEDAVIAVDGYQVTFQEGSLIEYIDGEIFYTGEIGFYAENATDMIITLANNEITAVVGTYLGETINLGEVELTAEMKEYIVEALQSLQEGYDTDDSLDTIKTLLGDDVDFSTIGSDTEDFVKSIIKLVETVESAQTSYDDAVTALSEANGYLISAKEALTAKEEALPVVIEAAKEAYDWATYPNNGSTKTKNKFGISSYDDAELVDEFLSNQDIIDGITQTDLAEALNKLYGLDEQVDDWMNGVKDVKASTSGTYFSSIYIAAGSLGSFARDESWVYSLTSGTTELYEDSNYQAYSDYYDILIKNGYQLSYELELFGQSTVVDVDSFDVLIIAMANKYVTFSDYLYSVAAEIETANEDAIGDLDEKQTEILAHFAETAALNDDADGFIDKTISYVELMMAYVAEDEDVIAAQEAVIAAEDAVTAAESAVTTAENAVTACSSTLQLAQKANEYGYSSEDLYSLVDIAYAIEDAYELYMQLDDIIAYIEQQDVLASFMIENGAFYSIDEDGIVLPVSISILGYESFTIPEFDIDEIASLVEDVDFDSLLNGELDTDALIQSAITDIFSSLLA